MRVTIISISCCNPALRTEDQEYSARVRNALIKAKMEAQVKIVTISQGNSSLSVEAIGNLRPTFERYGAAMLPAMLIDDELVLYGGVPTMEKISEVIDSFGKANHGGPGKQGRRLPENEVGHDRGGSGGERSF